VIGADKDLCGWRYSKSDNVGSKIDGVDPVADRQITFLIETSSCSRDLSISRTDVATTFVTCISQ
jgi:hypothetical protein